MRAYTVPFYRCTRSGSESILRNHDQCARTLCCCSQYISSAMCGNSPVASSAGAFRINGLSSLLNVYADCSYPDNFMPLKFCSSGRPAPLAHWRLIVYLPAFSRHGECFLHRHRAYTAEACRFIFIGLATGQIVYGPIAGSLRQAANR